MALEFPPLGAPFLALIATVIVAGVARGMSGFGSGMIIAPVAAAIYGPQVAIPMLTVLETHLKNCRNVALSVVSK